MKELEHIEELESDDVVHCPGCCKEIKQATDIDWQYLDMERHEVFCACGVKVVLECQRPVLIQVYQDKGV